MWQWVCHDDAGIQEHSISSMLQLPEQRRNVYVSVVDSPSHARDAMWVLDDYTQDHRTLGADEGDIVDDNDNDDAPNSDDEDPVIDDEESVVDDESPENVVIDNGDNHSETPQSDEKVVEATPDETKAIEMRKIAVIERNITHQGEQLQ